MIYNILQAILVLVTFIAIKYGAYHITENDKVPKFLHYEPYICYRCFGFWLLMAFYIACGLLCHLWITMALGALITVLDTIALSIHIKTHTIKIEDYDNDR